MPKPLLKRGLWALIIAAAVVVAGALALPYAASTRFSGDHIAQEMSAWSGFNVRMGAAPEISVWPDLQANLTNVTLSLPGQTGKPFITAERVEIELATLAALGGDIDFTRARFIRPTIRLADGAGLPAFPARGKIARAIAEARTIVAENSGTPDAGRLSAEDFGTVEFSDGRILVVSGEEEAEIARDLKGRIGWEALNSRANATAKGAFRGDSFEIELSSPSPLLLLGGAETSVSLTVKSAPANLSFNGKASLGENPYVEGKASFSAPSVRRLLDWPGDGPDAAGMQSVPVIGAIAVESRILGDPSRVRLEDASITLDGKSARGALDLLLTGKLPKLSGTLAFDTLDLVTFLSAFTPLDPSALDGNGLMDADFSSRLNLDLRLSAAKATVGKFALANVAATARIDESGAAFDISDAMAFGGNVQAGLRFGRKENVTPVEMRLLASDVNGGAFGTELGIPMLTPKALGTVSVILKGEGESWNALLASSSGSFSANFGPGTLSDIDLEALLARAQTGAPFGLMEVAKNGSPINSMDVKAVVTKGVARIEKAEIRTPLHRFTLTGTAPLTSGWLLLSATAEPPQQANAASTEPLAATTFLINGPWNATVVMPKVDEPGEPEEAEVRQEPETQEEVPAEE